MLINIDISINKTLSFMLSSAFTLNFYVLFGTNSIINFNTSDLLFFLKKTLKYIIVVLVMCLTTVNLLTIGHNKY